MSTNIGVEDRFYFTMHALGTLFALIYTDSDTVLHFKHLFCCLAWFLSASLSFFLFSLSLSLSYSLSLSLSLFIFSLTARHD